MMRVRGVWTVNVAAFLVGAGMYSSFVLLPAFVEGAKLTGEKVKEAGKAAEPPARSAWEKVRDGAVDFGQGVKNFFSRLFGG